MLKRMYKNQNSRKSGEIEDLKEEEKLLRERIKDLEGDPAEPYLTERLSFIERKIKKLQLEEKLSKVTSRLPYYFKERTVPDEDILGSDQKGTETKKFPKLMKIVNQKSRYYGQEVKPLKELNYGENLVIQVKLENGRTEIFEPEDLTGV